MLLSIIHGIVFEHIKGEHMFGDISTRGVPRTEIVNCCVSTDSLRSCYASNVCRLLLKVLSEHVHRRMLIDRTSKLTSPRGSVEIC